MSFKKGYFLFIFIFLIFCFLVFKNKFSSRNLKEVIIGDTKFLVEIADTPEKREKGLSGRDFLPENQGMLFIFERPDYYAFWMKGMKFPLDFVWINGETIVEVNQNVRPSDFQPPKVLRPKMPIDKVLEINSGMIEKFKIEIGEKIILK